MKQGKQKVIYITAKNSQDTLLDAFNKTVVLRVGYAL